jgi:hypothetical protein
MICFYSTALAGGSRDERTQVSAQLENNSNLKRQDCQGTAFQLFACQALDTNNVACLVMVALRCTVLLAKLAVSAGMPKMRFDLSISASQ